MSVFVMVFLSFNVYVNSNPNLKHYDLESLRQHLEEFEKDLNHIRIELNLFEKKSQGVSPTAVGELVDRFLGPRPWWYVIHEPYEWLGENETVSSTLEISRIDRILDTVLKPISFSQYPSSCDDVLLLAAVGGLNSFGNSWYNFVHQKIQIAWGVFTPYLLAANSFYDPIACPHSQNKFECAFIPATNCSLPDQLRNGTHKFYWTNAGHHGEVINNFHEFKKNISIYRQMPPTKPIIKAITTTGLFKDGSPHSVVTNAAVYPHFFGYAFLYRPNYHFRSMIAQILSEWKQQQTVAWPENHDCVAVRIRRSDRIIPNQNIYDWCRLHMIYPNGSCFNDQRGFVDANPHCVRYNDMGCDTGMPFAAITLEHALNASRTISSSKNILVGTEDGIWLKEQMAITKTDLNIFAFTAPPNHRNNAYGGAHYMAAIELARQCSALVGHTGSAVTMFFYNIMCIRHGDNQVGKCPPLYDFNGG